MIAARHHWFHEVSSTNDVALQMARAGEPEGTVVSALTQTKGRGRLGRTWWDRPGESAILSVLLRPSTQADQVGHLAFVAGLALANCLESLPCSHVALKWPNDVLVRGRKIAGILVEAATSWAVVGIGINVNQREFPPEIAGTATSLFLETGQQHDVGKLVEQVADALLVEYEVYLAEGFKEILTGWRKYMWGLDMQATVQTGEETVRGTITGADDRGALVLVNDQGAKHVIHAADSVKLV